MLITWQTIITAGAVLTALAAILSRYNKAHDWVNAQNQQGKDIADLQSKHDTDIAAIKAEQTILVYGILACLKGLKEQGCNGPVTEAINTIEKHLNLKAHE